jgi:hypothetical protein
VVWFAELAVKNDPKVDRKRLQRDIFVRCSAFLLPAVCLLVALTSTAHLAQVRIHDGQATLLAPLLAA